jgi:hypothetical protein
MPVAAAIRSSILRTMGSALTARAKAPTDPVPAGTCSCVCVCVCGGGCLRLRGCVRTRARERAYVCACVCMFECACVAVDHLVLCTASRALLPPPAPLHELKQMPYLGRRHELARRVDPATVVLREGEFHLVCRWWLHGVNVDGVSTRSGWNGTLVRVVAAALGHGFDTRSWCRPTVLFPQTPSHSSHSSAHDCNCHGCMPASAFEPVPWISARCRSTALWLIPNSRAHRHRVTPVHRRNLAGCPSCLASLRRDRSCAHPSLATVAPHGHVPCLSASLARVSRLSAANVELRKRHRRTLDGGTPRLGARRALVCRCHGRLDGELRTPCKASCNARRGTQSSMQCGHQPLLWRNFENVPSLLRCLERTPGCGCARGVCDDGRGSRV